MYQQSHNPTLLQQSLAAFHTLLTLPSPQFSDLKESINRSLIAPENLALLGDTLEPNQNQLTKIGLKILTLLVNYFPYKAKQIWSGLSMDAKSLNRLLTTRSKDVASTSLENPGTF